MDRFLTSLTGSHDCFSRLVNLLLESGRAALDGLGIHVPWNPNAVWMFRSRALCPPTDESIYLYSHYYNSDFSPQEITDCL